jgi:ABC-2 type transport system ATP-binding protein
LNRPRLIFLDEPTSGLDPIGRILVRDIVLKLREDGVTVFFNSHILTDIEAICDRVVFLKRGRVIQESRLADRNRIELELKLGAIDDGLIEVLASYGSVMAHNGTTLRLEIPDESCIPDITRRLVERNVPVYRVASVKRSLEAEFIDVMGEDERAG